MPGGIMSTTMLHKPAEGSGAEISIQPGRTYLLGFDSDSATYEIQAADILIVFDDGAVLRLKDFLRVTAHDDFTIALSDGMLISGRDAADMFTMVLDDFHTDSLARASGTDLEATPDKGAPLHASDAVLPNLLGEYEFTTPDAGVGAQVGPIPSGALAGFGGYGHPVSPLFDCNASGRDAPLSSGIVYSPAQAPGSQGEPLQIGDLLDTSRPLFPEAPPAPAFESLLDTPGPDTGQERALSSVDSLAQSDEAEQFLLALFGSGHFL